MQVDIYVRERNGNREIRFPWLPEEITIESGGITKLSYDIMNRGPVEIPTGTGLVSYSWESQFPGKNRSGEGMLRGSWQAPEKYHNILEDWRKKGTQLCILVTGYPINKDVFLDEYEATAAGGFGDLDYSLKFTEARTITITSTKVETKKTETTTRPKEETTSYTIKKGDTLWGIAKKHLGAGSKWKEIYDLNKEIIQSTAKARWKAAGINRDSQNGHWIFPGTVIKIPKS